jgi:CRP/FNR family transcriptional regulator
MAERIPEPGNVASALGAVSLFSELSPDELRLLAVRAVRKRFAEGELLFSEGDACRGLHIVASGKLRIFKSSPSGREQVLAVEGPGGSVAELPVFDGGPYPASVSAVEDSQILFISRDDFRRFCLEHPEVALKMLAVVGARLRRLVGIIEELSFATVRQRLVSALVRLAQTEGTRTEQGIEFQLPGTHQDLAHQLGTVRELVSRNLMRLQAEGLLQVDARSIVVRDMPGLTAILESNP